MNTYYLSYECRPLPGHENAVLYSGMLADVFVTMPSEDGVEELAETHLKKEGWMIERLDHAELVTSACAHDARFCELYRGALSNVVAPRLFKELPHERTNVRVVIDRQNAVLEGAAHGNEISNRNAT